MNADRKKIYVNLCNLRIGRSRRLKNDTARSSNCSESALYDLERLHALEHFVKRMVELAMLRGAPTQDRFEIGQIGDVDNLIDTLHERAHGVVRGEPVAEQNNKVFATLRAALGDHFAQNRIRLQLATFEVFVNHNHVVSVGLEFEHDVLLEQTEMHLVGHVDELRHDDLLVLLMVDTDESGVVAEVEKR